VHVCVFNMSPCYCTCVFFTSIPEQSIVIVAMDRYVLCQSDITLLVWVLRGFVGFRQICVWIITNFKNLVEISMSYVGRRGPV